MTLTDAGSDEPVCPYHSWNFTTTLNSIPILQLLWSSLQMTKHADGHTHPFYAFATASHWGCKVQTFPNNPTFTKSSTVGRSPLSVPSILQLRSSAKYPYVMKLSKCSSQPTRYTHFHLIMTKHRTGRPDRTQ